VFASGSDCSLSNVDSSGEAFHCLSQISNESTEYFNILSSLSVTRMREIQLLQRNILIQLNLNAVGNLLSPPHQLIRHFVTQAKSSQAKPSQAS
jgi:hypothetical protein